MTLLVCDASAVVALLLDHGSAGQWTAIRFVDADLAAPALMPFEAADVIRRHEAAGLVDAGQAASAHADLLDLEIDLWPHELVAARAWELRGNLSTYDASYVAVAEATGSTLVTLDRRIARAPGVRCPVSTPPQDQTA